MPAFFLAKEVCLVRKVDNENPSNEPSNDGDDAKHDENPAPALEAAKTVHAREAVSEDRGET